MESGGNSVLGLLGLWMWMQLIAFMALLLGGIYALYCLGKAAAGLDRLAAAVEDMVSRQGGNSGGVNPVGTARNAIPGAPVLGAPMPSTQYGTVTVPHAATPSPLQPQPVPPSTVPSSTIPPPRPLNTPASELSSGFASEPLSSPSPTSPTPTTPAPDSQAPPAAPGWDAR